MFLSYYGLENNLFNKKIKSKEAYKSSDYTNIQNRLKYLKDVKGIGIIVGSAGTGKTYSLRCFKEQMNPDLYKIIYISATRLTVFEFLNAICKELGLDVGSCYRNDIENKIQVAIKKLKKEEKRNHYNNR